MHKQQHGQVIAGRGRNFRCSILHFYVLSSLVLFCVLARGHGSADLTQKERSLAEYRSGPPDSRDPLLVVTLLGGHVVAVRSESGEVLWEYDTGTPLLGVSQGKAMPPGLHMLSGVDGGLYLYSSTLPASTGPDGGAAAGPTLERLPITLPELVETSPSLTDDGSIITGERRTRVFALDRRTGALLHVFSEGEAAAAAAGQGGGPLAEAPDPLLRPPGPFGSMQDVPVLQMLDPDRILLVGRQDFAVRSKQVLTDVEAWNATYSRIINLRPMGLAGGASRVPGGGPGPGGGAAPGEGGAAALPRFTVGADHTLQAYDPASRRRRWALRFKTPPVGVFSAEQGDTNFLDPAVVQPILDPDPPMASASSEPTPVRQRRRGGGSAVAGRQNLVLVGELKGSLYAMPAEHVVLDEHVEPRAWDAIALPGPVSDFNPVKPLPLLPSSAVEAPVDAAAADAAAKAIVVHSGGGGGVGSSSKDLVAYAMDVQTGEGVVSGLACRPPGLHLLATVGESPGLRQPWLPDAPKPGRLPGGIAAAEGISGGGAAATPLTVMLLAAAAAAGVGAVVVLVVLIFRGGAKAPSTAKAGTAARGGGLGGEGPSVRAAIDVAVATATAAVAANEAGARGNGFGAAGATAVGKAGGGGAGKGEGSRPTSLARGRRKGSHVGDAGGGGGAAVTAAAAAAAGGGAPRGSDAHLSSIPENQQLSSSGEASPSSIQNPSSASAAAHLPSAEPRVQLRGDGSLAIGRLIVGPAILGYGSAGTVVYEGVLDGRPVAVKRLLRQFTELARKEIEVLILSDEHPNVVRCFALEEDREFVYLALERCRSTLSDFLDTPAGRNEFVDPDTKQPTARCLSTLLDVCRGLAALHDRGIVHRDLKPHNVLLTESGIRAKLSDMGLSKQLVPEQSSFESHHGPGGSSGWQAPEQLIARDGGAARQTRSMDVFSLGCILYYCMTGGRHPFGDNHYERDGRILRGDPALPPLLAAAGPEAFNLVSACLAREPGRRPAVGSILSHPLWWSDERRLAFLVDISDRVEYEDREPDTSLLAAMESYAGVALASSGSGSGELLDSPPADALTTSPTSYYSHTAAAAATTTTTLSTSALAAALAACAVPNWGACLPAELVANLGRYRRYDYTSLRDLLRVVRNKRNHFREMPPTLQALMGPLPGGFLRFFTGRFPCLLLAVYVFALHHLVAEPSLQQYWGEGAGGGEGAEPFVRTFMSMYGNRMRPIKTSHHQQQQRQGGSVQAALAESPVPGGVGAASVTVPLEGAAEEEGLGRAGFAASDAVPAAQMMAAAAAPTMACSPSCPPFAYFASSATAAAIGSAPSPDGTTNDEGTSSSMTAAIAQQRQQQQQLRLSTTTTTTISAASSLTLQQQAPSPLPVALLPPHPAPLVIVGYEPSGDEGEVAVREFPRRPGKQLCEFYIKTGHCKFAESCVFDHPEAYAVRLTALGLPLRPEEQICSFYLKNNDCRFGPACKFHHPMLRAVYAGSAVAEGSGGGNGGGS